MDLRDVLNDKNESEVDVIFDGLPLGTTQLFSSDGLQWNAENQWNAEKGYSTRF